MQERIFFMVRSRLRCVWKRLFWGTGSVLSTRVLSVPEIGGPADPENNGSFIILHCGILSGESGRACHAEGRVPVKHILITAENAEFQVIQSLKTNRVKRSKMGEIFIEGVESIKQAVGAGIELTRIITHDADRLSDWAKNLIEAHPGARTIDMSFDLYKKLCDREEPTELIVTAKTRHLSLGGLKLGDNPFVLIFDRPSDHGNFGSIIRSANSFNVDAVFIVGHAIDFYESKVIRASLGSVFHSKIVNIESMKELEDWIQVQKKANGITIVGTDSTGDVSLLDKALTKPIALVLGNEAKGMSVALKGLCDYIISIPISGAVNSLNVSCAGSIFLWDVYRNSAGKS
jgi:tRNA G18 (ribose-2'-O)-methylase SpoU